MRHFISLLLLCASSSISLSQKIKPYAPELFPPEISGAVCGFTENGRLIFFVREDTIKDKLFFYQAERKGGKWINEQRLSFSGMHNDMGGRLSPDGLTLYFTSDRPGGSTREKDEWNIWKSERTGDAWSQPKPIGEINNKGNECCPLPMQNGDVIFSGDAANGDDWQMLVWDGKEVKTVEALTYASGWQWPSSFDSKTKMMLFNSMKRPDTKGKDDIYVSFLNNGQWSTPANIGAPVNTDVYEDGAILTPDGRYLIFNQHETGSTPSRVVFTKWKPILKRLKE